MVVQISVCKILGPDYIGGRIGNPEIWRKMGKMGKMGKVVVSAADKFRQPGILSPKAQ